MFDTLTRDQLQELHTLIYTGLTTMYNRLGSLGVFTDDYAIMTAWIAEHRETFDAISAEINRRRAVEAQAAALACCAHCTHGPDHVAATRGHVFACTACPANA
jgi:hypothetical protein